MYFKNYYLLILAFIIISCSSNMNIERKYYDNGQIKYEFKGKSKKSGQEKKWYENGNFKGVKNYKNGLKQGRETSYYSNGILLSISNWHKGKLHGKVKFYRNNGVIEYYFLYKKGQIQEQKWYDKKGNLFFYEKYYRKKGFSIVWRYADGKIISKKKKLIKNDENKKIRSIKLKKFPINQS